MHQNIVINFYLIKRFKIQKPKICRYTLHNMVIQNSKVETYIKLGRYGYFFIFHSFSLFKHIIFSLLVQYQLHRLLALTRLLFFSFYYMSLYNNSIYLDIKLCFYNLKVDQLLRIDC